MILGLDVGGTQTDAVLVAGDQVIRSTKTPTGHELIETLETAINHTLVDIDSDQIERMGFSTTMAINAIVQDRLEPAGMIVSAGPGMDPGWFAVGPSYHVVDGCIDHQGYEVKLLDKNRVADAVSQIKENGIEAIGLVGKFSVRNPIHEHQMAEWIGDGVSYLAMGHRVSGALNFPRRIATTYLNAALYPVQAKFSGALNRLLDEKGLWAPRYLLKPDGGTIILAQGNQSPARMAQSGPAASVMGALALDKCKGTTLILDVGGTTTDMAVILDGAPLMNPHGVRLGGYQTLIRSLLTHSLGLGGDSEVRIDGRGDLSVGPERKGRPKALGGPVPTPTDAMIVLDLLNVGDQEAARAAMAHLGKALGVGIEETAQTVLRTMADIIANAVRSFLVEINAQPVYTVHEVLKDTPIDPVSALIIGGPAPQISEYVARALDLPCRVPPHYDVANAVGAAVARVTTSVTLQADTERGVAVIPEANIEKSINARFDLEEAVALGRQILEGQARQMGADEGDSVSVVTQQAMFHMIRQGRITGKNIRLKLSVVPGLIPQWADRDDPKG